MENSKLKRIKRVAFIATLFVILGIGYAVIVSVLHFGIPCIFYEITGLKCPGCGITRGLMALFHFDICSALKYNAFLPFIVIYVVLVLIDTIKLYINTGKYRLGVRKEYISIIFLILLLLWSIIRNIIGI